MPFHPRPLRGKKKIEEDTGTGIVCQGVQRKEDKAKKEPLTNGNHRRIEGEPIIDGELRGQKRSI